MFIAIIRIWRFLMLEVIAIKPKISGINLLQFIGHLNFSWSVLIMPLFHVVRTMDDPPMWGS